MKVNIAPGEGRAAIIVFALSLLLCGCAAAPKEVPPSQNSAPAGGATSQSSPEQSSTGVAVGHGSSGSSSAPATVPVQSGGSATDVKWTVPSRWQTGPDKPMRSATYLIPAAAGDSEGGECAVFVGIGGGVDANIKRWIGQFEQPDGSSSEAKAKQKKEEVNGLPATTVDLTGTFTAGGGMAMGQPQVKKTNYRLLGAIVEGPSGEVFFKVTGPAKTIAAAQSEFQALVKSVKK